MMQKQEKVWKMLKRTRKTFIVSDCHFGHVNIALYCGRPYNMVKGNLNPKNISEVKRMNEDILKMFDSLPDDCDIWNLGDVFFPCKNDFESVLEMNKIISRMKGKGRRLFLVLGNHDTLRGDKTRIDFYLSLGFDKVYDTPVIVEDKWILSHEPVYITPGSNFVNLYGHTHDTLIGEDYFTYDYDNYALEKRVAKQKGLQEPEMLKRWPEKAIDLKNYKNVCLDHTKGILEWVGDTFKLGAVCWQN